MDGWPVRLRRNGILVLGNNPGLENLSGLEGIERVQHPSLNRMPTLADASALAGLQEVAEEVSLTGLGIDDLDFLSKIIWPDSKSASTTI
jgi:hypothetical protein